MLDPISCAQCGKQFVPSKRTRQFCSRKCFHMSITKYSDKCADCGEVLARRGPKRCKRCASRVPVSEGGYRGNRNAKGRGRPNQGRQGGHPWAVTLTEAQRETVNQIRAQHSGRETVLSEGWTVYMVPSTMPAKYLELRHHMSTGRTSRWVIEKDGSVSLREAA